MSLFCAGFIFSCGFQGIINVTLYTVKLLVVWLNTHVHSRASLLSKPIRREASIHFYDTYEDGQSQINIVQFNTTSNYNL